MDKNTISSLNVNEYSVYPNPVSDYLTVMVNIANEDKFTIELSDMSGRLVSTLIQNEALPVGNSTKSFDISGLTPGIYIYRIIAGSFSKTGKISKK